MWQQPGRNQRGLTTARGTDDNDEGLAIYGLHQVLSICLTPKEIRRILLAEGREPAIGTKGDGLLAEDRPGLNEDTGRDHIGYARRGVSFFGHNHTCYTIQFGIPYGATAKAALHTKAGRLSIL